MIKSIRSVVIPAPLNPHLKLSALAANRRTDHFIDRPYGWQTFPISLNKRLKVTNAW